MARRFNSGYSRGGSGYMTGGGGEVYGRGAATYEIRRHSFKRVVEVEPGTAKIIPLLLRTPDGGEPPANNIGTLPKIAYQGTKVYQSCTAQEGSRVDYIKLDITGHPKEFNTAVVMDIYGLDCALSFHDVKGGEVYGLNWDGTQIQYSDEAGTPTFTNVVSTPANPNAAPSVTAGPALPLSPEVYDLGDTIKHWWGRPYKNVMYGGEPLIATRGVRVPAKCRRIMESTFFGMMLMHGGASVANSDADTLSFEILETFMETPLVQ